MENQIEDQIVKIERKIKLKIKSKIELKIKLKIEQKVKIENFISQLILPDHIIFHILNQNSEF